jgi:spermidine synthase
VWFRLALALALFSGAGVVAVEVLSLHLMNLSVPTSFYPPAAVLFCVILLLAVAAFLTPYAVERFGSSEKLLPTSLALAALAICLMPPILLSFGVARTAELVYATSFGGFLVKITGFALLALGPAVLFCGFTFPLAVSLCSGSGTLAGRKLGLLLSINGLGGVAGGELARSVLVPAFGVHVALGVVGISYALVAVAVALWTRRRELMVNVLPIAALALAVLLTLRWLTALPLFYWGTAYSVLEVRSGHEGVLTVFEREGFGRGLSFNNQYLLGGSGSLDDEQRQSHIPLLLHPAPEQVCYAGLGTGITASGALQHRGVKSITAVEISEMVVEAAARHFGQFNGQIAQATNAVIHVEDARTYIAACQERFDVIIGDLFTPWRPGEAGLACLEYFRASQDALRTGGVFCQWFPMHQLTQREFEVIQSTFRTIFPRAYAFRNHLGTDDIPLALVGFKDSALDWEIVSRRCVAEREAGKLKDPLCRYPEGVAMLYFGELHGSGPRPPLNTLANLWVELDAGRNLVASKPGVLYSYASDGNPYPEFVRERRASWPSDKSVPDHLRPLLEMGLLVSRLEVAYDINHPAASKMEVELRGGFPSNVLSDDRSDWSLWAGNEATLQCLSRAEPPRIP